MKLATIAKLIMSEKIEVNVRYSDDEYTRGMIFSQRKSSFYKFNYLIFGASILIGFFAVYYLSYQSEGNRDLSLLLKILLALMIAIPLVYLFKDFNPTYEKVFKKQFYSSPLLQESYKISFDVEGINSESKSFANKLFWNAIIEVVQTDEDFHFFISHDASLFIPKRVFTNEQQNEIKNLVRIKLGDKAKF